MTIPDFPGKPGSSTRIMYAMLLQMNNPNNRQLTGDNQNIYVQKCLPIADADH